MIFVFSMNGGLSIVSGERESRGKSKVIEGCQACWFDVVKELSSLFRSLWIGRMWCA
jgi:hypothetical protein